MSLSKKQQGQLPMLLFMLQHRKYKQLIKSIINEKFSKNLLEQYGYKRLQWSRVQLFKIQQDSEHFTIEDLIQIKGSSYNKVKRYENNILLQTIIKKLKSNYHVQPSQRRLFWLQFTEIYNNPNLYQSLNDLQLPSDTQALLQKDIKRTYYNKPDYQTLDQKQLKTNKLRYTIKQALSKFALYNPYVLYCQGINQIVGFLCEEGFSSKEIFYIVRKITEELLPSDYYSSLDGIICFLKILWEMIAVLYPNTHNKLNYLIKQLNINGSYLCVFSHFLQWFVCLFTNNNINRQIRLIIFDYFILEGITVLFNVSLSIIQYLQPMILKINYFGTFLLILEQYVIKIQQYVKKYDDVGHLRKNLNNKFISKQIILLMKQYSGNPKQTSQKKFVPYIKKCSRKWNLCLQKLQNNIHEQHKYQCFVFKRKQNVKIIPGYLQKINNYYFNGKKNAKKIDQQMIGRIEHVCNQAEQTCTEDSLSQNNTRRQSPGSFKYSPSSGSKLARQREYMRQNQQNNNNDNMIDNNNIIPLLQPRQFNSDQKQKPQQQYPISQKILYPSNLQQIQSPQFQFSQQYHRKQTLQYRQLIKQKFMQQTQRKTLQKSESMMFMKMMVDNESYSNLFNLLENQEMNKMFDINSEDDQDGE